MATDLIKYLHQSLQFVQLYIDFLQIGTTNGYIQEDVLIIFELGADLQIFRLEHCYLHVLDVQMVLEKETNY